MCDPGIQDLRSGDPRSKWEERGGNGRKWEEMGGNGRAREGEMEGERKVLLLLAK